jgi:hypothetical protein
MKLNPFLALAITGSSATAGASDAADYVAEQARRSREQVESSYTFGSGIDQLRRELCAVCDEAAERGWDGYGAIPVRTEAYRNAYLLIEGLPFGTPLPTAGVEPDGHVTLEWHRGPRRTLSVSISPEGDLHFAALIGREKDYGTRMFVGEVPQRIYELIQRVCAE